MALVNLRVEEPLVVRLLAGRTYLVSVRDKAYLISYAFFIIRFYVKACECKPTDFFGDAVRHLMFLSSNKKVVCDTNPKKLFFVAFV